jgi:hypothetical protein
MQGEGPGSEPTGLLGREEHPVFPLKHQAQGEGEVCAALPWAAGNCGWIGPG